MEELKHFSHKHPLTLLKYDDSAADALCHGCGDRINVNTYVYRCVESSCSHYFLHETCSTLAPNIQIYFHLQHMLSLSYNDRYWLTCSWCRKSLHNLFTYECTSCSVVICLACSSPERDLDHASHNHTHNFSYLCKTCLFWIHQSCASAPPQLICKHHHRDHPLVLEYSLPQAYQKFGVSCNLCRETIHRSLWMYICADCRYFAHVQCVFSAIKSSDEDSDVEDVEDPDLVHFPVSDNKPFLMYELLQKFVEKFSASTEESSEKGENISHCSNGHLLVLFNDFNNKNDAVSKSRDHMICDGCVQPIRSTSDSFYGCLDCNFFLHRTCAAELPREFQHASHPEHKLVRCDRISKPNAYFSCYLCDNLCNGMFYKCDSCLFCIDLVCAALPSEIKHDSHKHKLKFGYKYEYSQCDGCGYYCRDKYRCDICKFDIHTGCARKPGRIRHRWDEHRLDLIHSPVKGHPHDFNCELCSEDINPNCWFYLCQKCDTSFHTFCADQSRLSNMKFMGIVKDDALHQHDLKFSPPGPNIKCESSSHNEELDIWEDCPVLRCVSCKFSVCGICTFLNGKV